MYPGTSLRPNDSRATLVKLVQNRLNALLGDDLKPDGQYGPRTVASVKLLQTRRGLTPDGIVGPVTWGEIFGLDPSIVKIPETPLLAGALAAALSQVGVRESGGPNRGEAVEKYLAAVKRPPGAPWCMAFACWSYQEGAASRRVPNPIVMTAGVHYAWKKAPLETKLEPHQALDDLRNIKPGMIYLIDHGFEKGHCGIVKVADVDGLHGVEGNTNVKGSRDGDGVYQRVRRYDEITLGYLDYARLVE